MELWGRAEVVVKLFDALKRHWLIAVRIGCEDVVVLAEPAREEVVGIEVLAGALLAVLGDVDAKPSLVALDGAAVYQVVKQGAVVLLLERW